MAAAQSGEFYAQVKRLFGDTFRIPYNPDELAYEFATRVAQTLPDGFESEFTPRYQIFRTRDGSRGSFNSICTYQNRFRPLREIFDVFEISREQDIILGAIDWTVQCGAGSIYMKDSLNPHRHNYYRFTCTICGNSIVDIRSGRTDNPQIPIVLSCGHAYHRGCHAIYTMARDHHCHQCDGAN